MTGDEGRRNAASHAGGTREFEHETEVRENALESTERSSILLVDDHPSNLLALEAVLEPLGQHLVRAKSGEEALARLAEREFAVVLMDVRMPGLDGFQTAARIRLLENARHTPIIFLTAHGADEALSLEGYAQSAVDFLVKPFNPIVLSSKVRVFVDLYQRGQTIRRQEAELRDAEREAMARDSETRFHTIIDLMPLCVIALYRDGTPYFCNQAWRDYTGFPIADASRDILLDTVHPEDRERTREALEKALSGFGQFELECRIRSGRDGSYRWHVARALPEFGPERNVIGWIATATDIERQKQAEQSATAANRTKDEFLAMVSHDLRTPLTAILGWVGLLLNGTPDPAKLRKGLETIQRNARAQALLIDDVLDVARILSGKLALEERAVDARVIVEGALDPVRAAAEAKGVTLVTDLDQVHVTSGDPDRLQQVVWNLAMNAVKFTPEGGTIGISVCEIGGSIAIEVRDTGRGIEAEFLPHVFDRFRQAVGVPSKREGGLGVGLAIVRHVIELHQGTVAAESAGPGQGSKFTVRIPVRSPPADTTAAATPAQPSAPPKMLEGVRILVVDDDQDTRSFLVHVLGGAGADVVTAPNSSEALDEFQKKAPHVVLSDIGLPGQDGYSFIQEIRARFAEKGARVPAAALTAHTRPEDALRALEAGFDRHVRKPIEPAEVVQIVAELSRRTLSSNDTESRTWSSR